MTTEAQPRAIRATIDPDAITRVASFFDFHIRDILNEVFQNSRRADATHIQVQQADGRVTITDDGTGIQDPQTILSFGRSDWPDNPVGAEHPAGMGFYALARCPAVSVSSRPVGKEPWTVTLTPQHFTGKADATIHDLPEYPQPHGTTIQFPWTDDITDHVPNAARYLPVAVTYNGESIDREDFLRDAVHIEHWEGLRIGVYHDPAPRAFQHNQQPTINFHGVTIYDPTANPIVEVLDYPDARTVRVDVVDCPNIELTLPARRTLVRTDFVDRLRDETFRAIYNDIVQDPSHPGVPWRVQQHALSLGVQIADADTRLVPWVPESQWLAKWRYPTPKPEHLPANAAVVSNSVPTAMQHTLAFAIEADAQREPDPILHLFSPDAPRLAGYRWYNELPRVTDVSITAFFGAQAFHLPDDTQELPSQRPDRIDVLARIQQEGQPDYVVTIPTTAAVFQDEYTPITEARPLVTAGADMTVNQLSRLIMAAYFDPDYDGESDTYQTQETWAQETANTTAVAMLHSPEQALQHNIIDALQSVNLRHLPPGSSLVVTLGHGQAMSVTINRSPSQE